MKKRLAESLVALVSANLVICISTCTRYFLLLSVMENMQHLACVNKTVEPPLCLGRLRADSREEFKALGGCDVSFPFFSCVYCVHA